MGFSKNLRMLRKAKGLKQSDVAKAIDKQPLTIGRYEAGTISPTLQVLIDLSHFFGLNVYFLVSDLSYDDGKKYSLQEIKELAIKTRAKEISNYFSPENDLLKSRPENDLLKFRPENDLLKSNQSTLLFEKDFSKNLKKRSDVELFQVITSLGDLFIKNEFGFTENEKIKLIEDLNLFIEFHIFKKTSEVAKNKVKTTDK